MRPASWRGRDRTCDLLIQSQAFCQLNYPPLGPTIVTGNCREIDARDCQIRCETRSVSDAMGSLIKKRRKRMRKKKHKKMLKRTRFQRRAKGK